MRETHGTAAAPPRFVVGPEVLRGLLGGAAAIALLGSLAKFTGLPLLIAPFGASSVLLFAAPASVFARPKNLILGHLIASAVGLAIFRLAGNGVWAMAVATGLAIAAMQITRSIHPPAGADPLVIMLSGTGSASFLLCPVLVGVLGLFAVSQTVNRVARCFERIPAGNPSP